MSGKSDASSVGTAVIRMEHTLKLCVECRHYRLNLLAFPADIGAAAKYALCSVKLEQVTGAMRRDIVTGVIVTDESKRSQAMCAAQRILLFPIDVLAGSCGLRGRWFDGRVLDGLSSSHITSAEPSSD